MNANIGSAAVILAYTYLAKMGLHPFNLAKKIVRQNSSDATDPDAQKCPK
jgi:hypothetical protein